MNKHLIKLANYLNYKGFIEEANYVLNKLAEELPVTVVELPVAVIKEIKEIYGEDSLKSKVSKSITVSDGNFSGAKNGYEVKFIGNDGKIEFINLLKSEDVEYSKNFIPLPPEGTYKIDQYGQVWEKNKLGHLTKRYDEKGNEHWDNPYTNTQIRDPRNWDDEFNIKKRFFPFKTDDKNPISADGYNLDQTLQELGVVRLIRAPNVERFKREMLKETTNLDQSDISFHRNDYSKRENPFYNSDMISIWSYIHIGCGYFYVPHLDSDRPVIVKEDSWVSKIGSAEEVTVHGYRVFVDISKANLQTEFKNKIRNIKGCNIEKGINPKNYIDIYLEDLGKNVTTVEDPRVDDKIDSDSAFQRAVDFVYCDYDPPKYKEYFKGPNTIPMQIFKGTLNKIRDNDSELYSRLQKQTLNNFNKIKAGKTPEEIKMILKNFICKDEINKIVQKYSGGDVLEKPNIPLKYDIGDMITPDGKHIPKPLAPQYEYE